MPCPVYHVMQKKKTKFLLDLVKAAQGAGLSAKYVHFDSWFSSPKTITALKNDCGLDELEDITFGQSMRIILDALMDTVMEYFHITEQQLEEFTAGFVQRLPKYMQDALEYGSAAA